MPRPEGARKRFRVLALMVSVSSLALGLVLLPFEASGDPPARKAAADAGPKYDPDNVTALSQLMELVGKGNDLYAAKDYPGAIDTYKKAIALNPRNPLGPYVLGEGYLAMNNLPEAEAAFLAAVAIDVPKTPPSSARTSSSRWPTATSARGRPSPRERRGRPTPSTPRSWAPKRAPHPLSGVARLKALDDALKLDQAYAIVRQRIAAEKSVAAADAAKK